MYARVATQAYASLIVGGGLIGMYRGSDNSDPEKLVEFQVDFGFAKLSRTNLDNEPFARAFYSGWVMATAAALIPVMPLIFTGRVIYEAIKQT